VAVRPLTKREAKQAALTWIDFLNIVAERLASGSAGERLTRNFAGRGASLLTVAWRLAGRR
jgi:hypothetical protein